MAFFTNVVRPLKKNHLEKKQILVFKYLFSIHDRFKTQIKFSWLETPNMITISKTLRLVSSLRLTHFSVAQFAKEKDKLNDEFGDEDEDEEGKEGEEEEEVEKTEEDLKREARAKIIATRLVKQRDRFATDSELHRIDIGLMINRPPIYFYISEQEMALMKYRYETGHKYKYIAPLPKDAMDFKRHLPVHNLSGIEIDNTPTHRIRHEDGTATSYSVNANYFTHVDPNINDNHSIQRCWQPMLFPC